jgi:hypothetical protein
MPKFDDALELVKHSEENLKIIISLHQQCLEEQAIKPLFLIEIKNFMENVRSALDYCASALFAKYGYSKKAYPKIYFPYAKLTDDRHKFRTEIVERTIPGLLFSRPDIVIKLESYQHFGNSGKWLPLFIEITNENKHEHLTPQTQKLYTAVRISGSIPPGGTVEINLSNIPLGGGQDKPFHAVAEKWTCLEFTTNEVPVLVLLMSALINVRKIIDELSKL